MDKIQDAFIACVEKKTDARFKKLYLVSSSRLYGVLLRILRQEATAQDCLQEVYMKIWQKMNLYNADKSQAMTWMSTIARNHALDTLRRKNLLNFSDDLSYVPDEDQATQTQTLMQAEESAVLKECIAQLKPEHAHCILLSYFKGLTYQSIADSMDKPVSTIKTWVTRSMPILKSCLEKHYGK